MEHLSWPGTVLGDLYYLRSLNVHNNAQCWVGTISPAPIYKLGFEIQRRLSNFPEASKLFLTKLEVVFTTLLPHIPLSSHLTSSG